MLHSKSFIFILIFGSLVSLVIFVVALKPEIKIKLPEEATNIKDLNKPGSKIKLPEEATKSVQEKASDSEDLEFFDEIYKKSYGENDTFYRDKAIRGLLKIILPNITVPFHTGDFCEGYSFFLNPG